MPMKQQSFLHTQKKQNFFHIDYAIGNILLHIVRLSTHLMMVRLPK